MADDNIIIQSELRLDIEKAEAKIRRIERQLSDALKMRSRASGATPLLDKRITALRDNLDQTRKEAGAAKKELASFAATGASELSVTERVASGLAGTMAAVFSVRAAKEFLSQVISIRGQFQQLEIAFETLLGSREKADKLLSGATELAAKTPFDLMGVASGARQLIAYGFEADKVIETMRRLGDVAAGLGLPLQRLTYLYGTTRVQGRLYARDMLQFTNSGIPVLDELAKMYGKTTAEINAMVSAGKIGFADVEKVFLRMTDEGGKFANLMEKQSSSITGRISNIKDAIDVMFNEIGKNMEGPIYKSLDVVGKLVENYEKVGKVLGPVIASYGAYRAALLLLRAGIERTTMTESGYTIALGKNTKEQYKNIVAAGQSELAHRQLSKAILANPYVLLGSAVVALTAGLIAYTRANDFALQSQKSLNKSIADSTAETTKEMTELNRLYGKLNTAKKGTDEYNKARDELVKNYGKYFDGLEQELEKVGGLTTAYNTLSESIKNAANARAYDNFMDKLGAEHQERLSDAYAKILGAAEEKFGKGSVEAFTAFNKIIKAVADGGELPQDVQELVDSFDEIVTATYGTASQTYSYTYNAVKGAIGEAKDATTIFNNMHEAAEKTFGAGAEKSELQKAVDALSETDLSNLLGQIKAVKDEVMSLDGGDRALNFNGTLFGFRKVGGEVKPTNANGYSDQGDTLEQIAAKRKAQLDKDAADAAAKAEQERKARQQAAASQIRARDARRRAEEAVEKAELDAARQSEKARIDVMEDGIEKELELAEYGREEGLRRVDEQKKQYIDKLKDLARAKWKAANPDSKGEWDEDSFKLTDGQKKFIEDMYGDESELRKAANSEADKAIKRSLDKQIEDYGNYYEKRALSAREWDKKIEAAEKGLTMAEAEEDKKRLQSSIDAMRRRKEVELAEADYDFVSEYGGATQQRSALERVWAARIADAAPGMREAMIRARDEALEELDADSFRELIDWDAVFGDMGEQSTAALQRNMAAVRQYLEANRGGLGVDQIRDMEEALASMSDEIASRNPFDAIRLSVENLRSARAALPGLVQDYKDALAALEAAKEEHRAATERISAELDAAGTTDERRTQLVQEQVEADGKLDAAQKAVTDSTKALNSAQGSVSRNTMKLIEGIDNTRSKFQGLGGSVRNLVGVLDDDLAAALGEAMDLFGELGDIAMEILETFGEAGTEIVTNLKDTAEGAADAITNTADAASSALSAAEEASVVLLIVKAAIVALTAVFRIVKAGEEAERKAAQAAREYAQAIRDIEDAARRAKLVTIFGEDALGRFRQAKALLKDIGDEIRNTVKAAQDEALRQLPAELKDLISARLGDFSYTLSADMRSGWQKFWGTGQQNIIGKDLADFVDGEGNILTDALSAWYDEYGEYLSESERQLVDELLSQGERYGEALGEIEDYLQSIFGSTADSIADAMLSAFEQSGDAAADFADIMGGVAKNIAKSWVVDKLIGEIFNGDAEKRMSDLIAANDISGAVNFYNGLIEKANESAPAINEFLRGLDIDWAADGRTAATRSSLGASQDSVDESNARLTAIQGHTFLLSEDVRAIRAQNEALTAHSAALLEHVQGIHVNTNQMAALLDEMRGMASSIRNNVATMTDRGVKIQ